MNENVLKDEINNLKKLISDEFDIKYMKGNERIWDNILNELDAKVSYKSNFITYQEQYFKEKYDEYYDLSLIFFRGGGPIGIWPLSIYVIDKECFIGSSGTAVLPPLLKTIYKNETKRSIYEYCINLIKRITEFLSISKIEFQNTIMPEGVDLWSKKLMEHNCTITKVTHDVYVDLSLSADEIQKRTRRTNKYSIIKGSNDYDIEIYDETCDNLNNVFSEFHEMHKLVSGRETRSQLTWDIQKYGVEHGSKENGESFVIFIRDKKTKKLAGAALFDTTKNYGLYCVAAYDRSRFSKPVGHIVQAAAIDRMRSLGVHWYEVGERPYITDMNATEKTVNIGHYKEGFATNTFLRVNYMFYIQHENTT